MRRNKMKTNELKSGDRIRLDNGWFGTIKDNKKGNIRLCEVEGYFTELGSVYVWDIRWYINPEGEYIPIELTPKQNKDMQRVKALGF